jgi:hypothetical protein
MWSCCATRSSLRARGRVRSAASSDRSGSINGTGSKRLALGSGCCGLLQNINQRIDETDKYPTYGCRHRVRSLGQWSVTDSLHSNVCLQVGMYSSCRQVEGRDPWVYHGILSILVADFSVHSHITITHALVKPVIVISRHVPAASIDI